MLRSSADLDAGFLKVERPVLLIGAEVTEGRPKSRAGERLIWLDAETIRLLREHRIAQLKTRMKAGPTWTENDLVFCPAARSQATRSSPATARQTSPGQRYRC